MTEIMMGRKAAKKKAIRDSKWVSVEAVEEVKTQRILSLHAYELAQAIKNKEFTCVEVMKVYVKRAQSIGREYNLNADEMFEEALQAAAQADLKLASSPDQCGPLHGIPMSIKDHIAVAGTDATTGCAQHCFNPDTEDANIVMSLKNAGAIPFVKSNVPQILMANETDNAIFGTAKNPWDPTRSPGGSSGGEAGLIASRCSPLGLGSDIGGSIRMPASECGIYGLKPTPERHSTEGVYTAASNRQNAIDSHIHGCIGPMGTCVEDLALTMRTMFSEEAQDMEPYTYPIPFDEDMLQEFSTRKNLRIGYFTQNGYFQTSKPVIRAIEMAKEALEKMGHTLVEFEVPDAEQMHYQYFRILMADGYAGIEDCLQGEAPNWLYGGVYLNNSNVLIKKVLFKIARTTGFGRLVKFLEACPTLSSADYIQEYFYMIDYREMFTNKWKEMNLDAMISPAMATPATTHKSILNVFQQGSYSQMYNYLDYPAGTIPITLVRSDEMVYDGERKDGIDAECEKIMQGSAGLPIGIQVAALNCEDEKVLGVMKQLQDVIKFHKFAL